MALPAARTSLPLTIKLSPLTPTPILLQNNVDDSCYKDINKRPESTQSDQPKPRRA
ncbi:hypothetical protein PILCRDRAFT_3753 [Piloderma croceum F 1598]|uniref:Uncharacterized protein n=1 Tax=Piloderma croceum (strain F 1598) TaxID=765440 RepID=A0A0C3BNK5_PILCF|nr:hypothetical protein PILCRDRAFT_3753 [Piloderma croceum F 1598]